MSWQVSANGVLVEAGDDSTQTVTDYHPDGTVASTRPYTAAEVAAMQAGQQAAAMAANLSTLTSRAQAALGNNATFLAAGTPTNAQAVAQVGALTRQMNAVIRLLVGIVDSTSGT